MFQKDAQILFLPFFDKMHSFCFIVKNVYGKWSAKRKYHDENTFLNVNRALSKLITLLISNKKEFNHFFKSRSSDIVLLKLGNLYQNAKRNEARNSEREARSSHISEREARRSLGRAPYYRRENNTQLPLTLKVVVVV